MQRKHTVFIVYTYCIQPHMYIICTIITILQNQIYHGYSQPKSELFELQVPSLATLTYEDSTITVTTSGTSLYRIPDIKVLKLTDIPGGNRTLFGESNYKFTGYGKKKSYFYIYWYRWMYI